MQTNSVSGSSKSGGLLSAAHKAGQTETINWVDVQVGDLIIHVASDAIKGPLNDRTGVRLPITYAEQVAICREMGWVSQTQAIADAMFARATSQLTFVPLVRTAADSMKMGTVDFTLKFHDGVQKQLANKDPQNLGLVFGAWKLWILHPRIVECGAINYGFWDKSQKPPKTIQSVGGRHDAAHYDYSQVFQPVKRIAHRVGTGEEVDLLEYFATKDKIPAKYLAPYKEAPTQGSGGPAAFTIEYDELDEPDLVEILKRGGVDVVPADGWKTRGKPGFAPEGIMLHHTAGPKKGDAPSLGLCIAGRLDTKNPANNLPGPLCHIVLARSGKAHVISGNLANHAGKGSKEVLEKVRRDEPVLGNAQTHKYIDAVGGNTYFYGIEIENAGVGDDPYPQAQIDSLVKICAALCSAHKWSPNRIVHHRQWTGRKIDMSYRGDIPAMVAQLMDSGAVTFGVSFFEEEDEPLTGTEPCLPWGEPEGPASFFDEGDDEPSVAPTEQAPTAAKTKAPAAKRKPAAAKKKAPTAKKKAPAAKKKPAAAKKNKKKTASAKAKKNH